MYICTSIPINSKSPFILDNLSNLTNDTGISSASDISKTFHKKQTTFHDVAVQKDDDMAMAIAKLKYEDENKDLLIYQAEKETNATKEDEKNKEIVEQSKKISVLTKSIDEKRSESEKAKEKKTMELNRNLDEKRKELEEKKKKISQLSDDLEEKIKSLEEERKESKRKDGSA